MIPDKPAKPSDRNNHATSSPSTDVHLHHQPHEPEAWDVVIVGGGSAGLSAALMLVRARRRVLVLDGGLPRNRFATHMHGVLGHDGLSPLELLARGRQEIEFYGGVIGHDAATTVRRAGDGFQVLTTDGEKVHARKLLVATGARDELPDVQGLTEHWGTGVASCPYCDGYEVRDTRIGVLATGPDSLYQAQLLRQWSHSVTYLCHRTERPEPEDMAALAARGITVEVGQVRKVRDDGHRLTGIQFADDRELQLDAIYTMPRLIPSDDVLRQLEADRTEHQWGSFVSVDTAGKTSVPGVWAAGNVVDANAKVAIAAAAGVKAGTSINQELVFDDIQLALASVDPVGVDPRQQH